MDAATEKEFTTLLSVIFGLQSPEEGELHLQVKRPEDLDIPDHMWLQGLVEAIVGVVALSFDLRRKRSDDNPDEIEHWEKSAVGNEWTEKRKNHRLRIRTTVDDLFEESLARPDVTPTFRAWKIQVVDMCADAVLDRFYVRPTSSGSHAVYRRVMYQVGQDLQQALGCKTLFLLSGRTAEVKTMETAIERAYQRVQKLAANLENNHRSDRS